MLACCKLATNMLCKLDANMFCKFDTSPLCHLAAGLLFNLAANIILQCCNKHANLSSVQRCFSSSMQVYYAVLLQACHKHALQTRCKRDLQARRKLIMPICCKLTMDFFFEMLFGSPTWVSKYGNLFRVLCLVRGGGKSGALRHHYAQRSAGYSKWPSRLYFLPFTVYGDLEYRDLRPTSLRNDKGLI